MKRYLPTICLAALLAACTHEEPLPVQKRTVSFSCSLSETKASLSEREEGRSAMLWDGNETIIVTQTAASGEIQSARAENLQLSQDGSTISFTADFVRSGSGPWTFGASCGDDIPAVQSPSARSFDPAAIALQAVSRTFQDYPEGDVRFTFTHSGAYGLVKLPEFGEGEIISVALTPLVPGKSLSAEGGISIECGSLSPAQGLHFCCLPESFDSPGSLQVTLQLCSGQSISRTLSTSSSKALTFDAGKIHSFSVGGFRDAASALVGRKTFEFDLTSPSGNVTVYNQSAEMLYAEVDRTPLCLNLSTGTAPYLRMDYPYSRNKLTFTPSDYASNGSLHLRLVYGGAGSDAVMCASGATISNLRVSDAPYTFGPLSPGAIQPDILHNWSSEKYFIAAKAMGWDYVSLCSPASDKVIENLGGDIENVLSYLESTGLKINSIHLPYEVSEGTLDLSNRGNAVSTSWAKSRNSSVNILKKYIEAFAVLRPRNMLVHSNGTLNSNDGSVSQLAKSLDELQSFADSFGAGIQIVVENMSAGVGASSAELVQAVEMANAANPHAVNIGIAMDTGHAYNYITSPYNGIHETLASYAATCGERISMVHICGNRGWDNAGNDVFSKVRDDHCYPFFKTSGEREDLIEVEQWRAFYRSLIDICHYHGTFCYEIVRRQVNSDNGRTYFENLDSPWHAAHNYYSKILPLYSGALPESDDVNFDINGVEELDWIDNGMEY